MTNVILILNECEIEKKRTTPDEKPTRRRRTRHERTGGVQQPKPIVVGAWVGGWGGGELAPGLSLTARGALYICRCRAVAKQPSPRGVEYVHTCRATRWPQAQLARLFQLALPDGQHLRSGMGDVHPDVRQSCVRHGTRCTTSIPRRAWLLSRGPPPQTSACCWAVSYPPPACRIQPWAAPLSSACRRSASH